MLLVHSWPFLHFLASVEFVSPFHLLSDEVSAPIVVNVSRCCLYSDGMPSMLVLKHFEQIGSFTGPVLWMHP
jgi:hypothetical protein